MKQEIIVDGITYIPKDAGNSEIKIIILQRGWVAVGKFHKKETDCRLLDAYIIRRWGTTKGLGELALEGPTSDTILDKAGTMYFDSLTVVASLDCNKKIWEKFYEKSND
jgi:hypothetical protein